MPKLWTRILLMLLCLSVLPAHAGIADGNRSDDSQQLQMKLFNMGFMQKKPDGEFDAEIEAGVQAFQHYWGLDETGKADQETLDALDSVWNLAIGVTDVTAVPVDASGYPASCRWTAEEAVGAGGAEESGLHAQYCARHAGIQTLKELCAAENTPSRLLQLLYARESALWMSAINGMYEEWEHALGWKENDIAGEQRDQFRAALTAKRKEWEAQFGRASEERHSAEAEWMEQAGMELCLKLHGALQETEPKEDVGSGVEAGKGEGI